MTSILDLTRILRFTPISITYISLIYGEIDLVCSIETAFNYHRCGRKITVSYGGLSKSWSKLYRFKDEKLLVYVLLFLVMLKKPPSNMIDVPSEFTLVGLFSHQSHQIIF